MLAVFELALYTSFCASLIDADADSREASMASFCAFCANKKRTVLISKFSNAVTHLRTVASGEVDFFSFA